DGEFGDVYFFDFDATPADVDWQGSAHEVEMLQTLIMMEMLGDRPKTFVLGVIPTVIEPMFMGITEQIKNAVSTMEQQLKRHLTQLGFTLTIKQSICINDVIVDAQKR
ncbi:hydrogenase, partial [Psychromonas sp. PRT-SC03]